MIGVVIYLIIGAVVAVALVAIDDRAWHGEVFHSQQGASNLVGIVVLWPAVVIMIIGIVISTAIEVWREMKDGE